MKMNIRRPMKAYDHKLLEKQTQGNITYIHYDSGYTSREIAAFI